MPKLPKNPYAKIKLEQAVEEVQNNQSKLSVPQIAEKYGVPSSLRFHVANPGHKTSCGPSPIISSSVEGILEEWIISSARKGFPINKDDVLDSVQKFLIDNPRPHPFTNNRPGDDWWNAFLKRHPRLTVRRAEGATRASSFVGEADIRGWFREINHYCQQHDLLSVFDNPNKIFNADETNFQICTSFGKVVTEKSYRVENSNSKESITVLFTFSGAGETVCPFVVYPYKRMPEKILEALPSGWGIGKSDKRWITIEVNFFMNSNYLPEHSLVCNSA